MKTTSQLCKQLAEVLIQRNLTVAVAESCTGGGLAYHITDLPGSSDWFECGFVTYSNAAKMTMLNVSQALLTTHGAVSMQAAQAMVEGTFANSSADFAVSITGIAGPGGGSAEKPVGTVWFGVGSRGGNIQTHLQHFSGDRNKVRSNAIDYALNLLINIASID